MDKRLDIALLIGSISSYFIVAASLTAMAFGGSATSADVSLISMICGICFWLFLIVGIVLQIILSRRIGRWRAKYYRIRRSMRIQPKIGLISFLKSPLGMVSDIVFLLSVITFAIAYYFTEGIGITCYISLSLIFFSFCSHCVFNGKNYYYISNRQMIEDKHKKMMEESQ